MTNPYWPLFDLGIRTPRVELRFPDDEALVALAGLAAEGIHEPDRMPFYVPWTRATSPALERGVLQHLWLSRASLAPDHWKLPFVVYEDARPVGVQELSATHYPVIRSVESGSWLVQRAQGRGLGTEMRAAVLHLAFDGLGAAEAHSASFEDNPASQRVSLANGYQDNGSALFDREGQATRTVKWRLTREDWLARRRDDITIVGLDACREFLE